MALVHDGIESLRPYEAGKPIEELARELGIVDAIKLASNENALGTSPKVQDVLSSALGELHRYPDAAQYRLREALAEFYRVPQERVVAANGSNEVLELLVRTFCSGGQHVVFAHPSFVVYRSLAIAAGIPFTAVPLTDHRHDLDAMLGAIQDTTRLVFIANANNPTGTYVGRTELERFLDQVPEDVIVVLDEAYIEYATAADFPDGLTLQSKHPRVVLVRTFSKAYGLAALRVGYALIPTGLGDYLDRVRAPFNVNALAQLAARAALTDQDHVRQSREHNHRERARLSAELEKRGLQAVPSQANFVLVGLGRSGADLYQRLLREGVIVRPIPPYPEHVRVTIGLESENDRFLAALDKVLA
jgi:histidinol-phosphate aminotransferase